MKQQQQSIWEYRITLIIFSSTGIEELIATAYPLYCLIGLLGLPWFWSLPPALITAEMSSALPSNMGYIIWVKTAFGNFASFQVGCWRWVNQLFDNALYPVSKANDMFIC